MPAYNKRTVASLFLPVIVLKAQENKPVLLPESVCLGWSCTNTAGKLSQRPWAPGLVFLLEALPVHTSADTRGPPGSFNTTEEECTQLATYTDDSLH